MQHLSGHADGQAIEPAGFLVVEHEAAAAGAEQTSQHRADGTGQLAEGPGAPIGGEPAVCTADNAGDDARRAAEEQSGGQRRGVAHVQHRAVDGDARLGGQHGDEAEQHADDGLLHAVAELFRPRLTLRHVQNHRQRHRQQRHKCQCPDLNCSYHRHWDHSSLPFAVASFSAASTAAAVSGNGISPAVSLCMCGGRPRRASADPIR